MRDRDDGALPTVRIDRGALADAAKRKGRFRLPRLPLRRDLEVELELERFYVTRSDTRFVLGRKDGPDEVLDFDASEVPLFRGEVVGRPGSRVVLVLRDGHHTGSIDLGPGEPRYWISSRGRDGEPLDGSRATVFQASAAPELPPEVPFCGVDGDFLRASRGPAPLTATRSTHEPRVGLLHMELAVDTDYEFFQLFGDASEAAAYLVALYGQVSDIYLRDQDTRVELVFARIWETPDDLYNDVDPSPLSDFQAEWNASMGSVQRDVAQLLSGRRDYPFGGQAFLSTLCGASAYSVVGYAVGSFPDPTQPSPFHYDISVTAHEIGHNAGTGHTHDIPNLIDECDDPLSTPQRGTIMSYCGQTWSGGNANRDLYFHSVIQGNIDAHIAASSCIVEDCNLNGVADALDISGGTSLDANVNGVPDECEDCDDNGTLDPTDIAMGAADVDGDDIPDVCEPDCNGNGVPDDEDIALGTSTDAYGNDIPDECETDCDTDGTSDFTEIQLDMTLDIDRNAQLDACQDCDGDLTPDLTELSGAHGLWLASGLAASPLREFYATTGVLTQVSGGGGSALMAEAQDLLIVSGTRVLVSSATDSRVAEFTLGGSYLGDLVTTGSGGLAHPAGLVVAPSGDLLVASHDTDEVLAYDLVSGAPQGAFVAAGSGGLAGPFGLAFGPNGNLFVTREDGGVMEYDGTTGALVGTFVDPLDNGGLTTPRHILFKPDGNLLVTSFGTSETLEFRRDTGFPLGRWAKSGNESGTRLNQESPWGLRIGPTGNVFIVRTGEAFGSSGGGNHDHDHDHGDGQGTGGGEAATDIVLHDPDAGEVDSHDDHHHDEGDHGQLHLTNAQIYEFDVATGNFLRAHINGNDHGMEFPTGLDFVPGYGVDCNTNQLPDSCDISTGASLDLDTNGIPDECEADCNGNGIQDRLDLIPFGTSLDCNANLVPDECDSAAGVPAACEPATEVSCQDGFDNDRDGLFDCDDADCDATGACLGAILTGTGFDVDAELFGYVDDAFRGTGQPAYASGSHGASGGFEGGGGLAVSLGGLDSASVLGMSGGWRRSFDLTTAQDVTLSFRYRMDQSPDYESDEFSQVLLTVDGSLVGTMGNDYVVQLTGDGNGGETRTTGWVTVSFDLGTLAAGTHTFTIGGYNNKKTFTNEFTTLLFDDVGVHTVLPFVCGDGTVSPGEDCDYGGTVDGDCCSSTCSFEGAGSSCDDADACTESDACDGAGACGGTPVVCDDGNPCTVPSCDPMSGCAFTPIPGCGPVVPAASDGAWWWVAAMLALAGAIALRDRRVAP